jgi:flavorubredoxin
LAELNREKKAFIFYYSSSSTHLNEEKVALRLEELFKSRGVSAEKILLEPKKKLNLKQQLRMEKKIELKNIIPPLQDADYVVIGSPVVNAFGSSPIVNSFIRSLPKKDYSKTKVALFSCGILPGFAIKKMSSLLSLNGVKVSGSQSFTSIFEFDKKKLGEVDAFFEKII